MAAGVVLSQSQLDVEISSRLKQIARLKSEMASIKAVMDGLTQSAALALPLGGRALSWDATDWSNLVSAVNAKVTELNAMETTFAARVWGLGF